MREAVNRSTRTSHQAQITYRQRMMRVRRGLDERIRGVGWAEMQSDSLGGGQRASCRCPIDLEPLLQSV